MAEDKVVLQLDPYWRIESDARSWNLLYGKAGEINPTTGRPVQSRDASYHMNLKQALVAYLEKDMAEASGAKELIARIEQAERNVEAAVDRLFKQMQGAK